MVWFRKMSLLIHVMGKKMNDFFLIPSVAKTCKKRREEERITFLFLSLMNTKLIYIRMHIRHTK